MIDVQAPSAAAIAARPDVEGYLEPITARIPETELVGGDVRRVNVPLQFDAAAGLEPPFCVHVTAVVVPPLSMAARPGTSSTTVSSAHDE